MSNRKDIEIIRGIRNSFQEDCLDKIKALDLAIKAVRIIQIIEHCFKRDSNLMMDSDDWKDIKEFVEKEAENDK